MKKKIVALVLTTIMVTGTTITTNACTPSYKPVSSQPWYKSYNKALDSAYNAGKNVASNIKIDPKFFENIKIN